MIKRGSAFFVLLALFLSIGSIAQNVQACGGVPVQPTPKPRSDTIYPALLANGKQIMCRQNALGVTSGELVNKNGLTLFQPFTLKIIEYKQKLARLVKQERRAQSGRKSTLKRQIKSLNKSIKSLTEQKTEADAACAMQIPLR
ncbi:MAG: hypothetical protein GYA55_03020 [SAR324 cluster bacterium]|uniref:Uncharacterized protein n=1 Tax=SAR324 cluster bacterium TaxID=2024889 RepID=A0A7X9FQQ4_9DELT|nr:hypothetical protein [SAR324 cluster bacterium]